MPSVLYDYQIFSLQQYGGISRYFSELAVRMDRFDDVSATVLCPLSVNRYRESAAVNRGITIAKVPHTGWLVQAANRWASRLYCAVRRFDIVHRTYFLEHERARAKVVITVYDMINELFPQHFPENDTLAAAKKKSLKHADAVICISQATRSDLLRLIDIDPAKVLVTHLGFSRLPAGDGRPDREGPARPYLLYVGKRGGHKNFNALLKAYAASPGLKNDVDLVCFGDVPFARGEQETIGSLGLSPQRVHHVAGDDGRLARWYRRAAAFVCPSLYEGFGIPVLEAMSCRCPVICSAAGSLAEVAGDAAEIFDPVDIDAIRQALQNVFYHPSRADELVRRGVERCRHFSWDRCARETREIYLAL